MRREQNIVTTKIGIVIIITYLVYINYWKLVFRIYGFLSSKSKIICPNRPFTHENLYHSN